jgi:hypothetical protein
MDLLSAFMLPGIDVPSVGRPEVLSPAMLLLGLALILLTPVALWQFYPLLSRRLHHRKFEQRGKLAFQETILS